jgi:hypothetical protein
MTERRTVARNSRIHVAEAMGLIAVAAVVFRWPLTVLVAVPVVLYLGSQALGITPARKTLVASALGYLLLVAYPLSSGPVIRCSLGSEGAGSPGFAHALGLYRPLFRATAGTGLGRSLWEYVEWWAGPIEVEW